MHLKAILVAATLMTSAGLMHADTINVFNLAGTTSSGTLSGTVTLNATTGKFTAASISYFYTATLGSGTYTFSGSPLSSTSGTGYSSNDFAGTGPATGFDIDLSLPTVNLMGYSGGALCSTTRPCGTQVSAFEVTLTGTDLSQVIGGTLTLASQTGAPAVTPEPSSLLLLGTGVLGVASVMRKRFV